MTPTQEQLLAAFSKHPQLFMPTDPQQQEEEGGPETLFGDGLYELITFGDITYRYDKEVVADAITAQGTRLNPKFINYRLFQLYESLETWEKAEANTPSVRRFLVNSIASLKTEIKHRESAIADLLEQHMIVHCHQWLINARTVADGFGRSARASLEEALGYVAGMNHEPNARCHITENCGNHPEYQADFLCTWRISDDPKSAVLSVVGVFLFIGEQGNAYWKVCGIGG